MIMIELIPLLLTTSNAVTNNLAQKEITASHKTLGGFKSILQDEHDHYVYLLKKSNRFANIIANGQVSRRQANLANNTSYISSMAYSLPATCLTPTELINIQKGAIGKFQQQFGFEKNFPRAVVYGPPVFGGLGINQLYSTSICQKVETILCHLNLKTNLGSLFGLIINLIQCHSGQCQPIMSSKTLESYIPRNWFTTVREYLILIKSIVTIQSLWVPQLLRRHDRILMDAIISTNFTISEIQIFNNWRVYFKVSTLAEMCNAYGDSV
jgi:hypothetical protein